MKLHQPLSPDERLARIRSNALRFRSLPRLRLHPDNDLKLAVCGYGPSLSDTWQEVKKCDRVMTTSGAHDFLLGKGVIPDLHAELDPREHKAVFVRESHAGVTYHLAAHCHPKMYARLVSRKRNVVMYYACTKDDKERQVAQVIELEGGDQGILFGLTTVGQLAIRIGRAYGYRHFELHGMDCCFKDEATLWAGPHTGRRHDVYRVRCDGREFLTSPQMMESTDDFFRNLTGMPQVTFTIHGDGLLQARLKLYKRDPALALSSSWWEPVDFVRFTTEQATQREASKRVGMFYPYVRQVAA